MTDTRWHEALPRLLAELPPAGVAALKQALRDDDPALIHKAYVRPFGAADEPVERACLIGYCLWKGSATQTVVALMVAIDRFASRTRVEDRQAVLGFWDGEPTGQARKAVLAALEGMACQPKT